MVLQGVPSRSSRVYSLPNSRQRLFKSSISMGRMFGDRHSFRKFEVFQEGESFGFDSILGVHQVSLIECKISPFTSNGNANKYYDCELKEMQNLDCLNFNDYTKCRGLRRAPIESWEELKKDMQDRFVPLYYNQDLFMYQGPRYVDKCFKEMEVTLGRAQIVESQEVTIARF
ncbi:hypothetical protein CR513_07607, partial [Mucuna pruriens]